MANRCLVSLTLILVTLVAQVSSFVQPVQAASDKTPVAEELTAPAFLPAISAPPGPVYGPVTYSQAVLSSVVATAAQDAPAEIPDDRPTTLTDVVGHYRFVGLPRGSHRITLDLDTLPAPWQVRGEVTSPVIWVTPGTMQVSDALPNGARFTAAYDRASGDIYGVVFVDENGNGRQDAGEPGLPNVRVIDPTAHQYFVPFNDADLWDLFAEKTVCHGESIGESLVSSIFLVSSYDGTIYYYDHWEDGYDVDSLVPGATTEAGVLDAGAVQLFQSNITKAGLGSGPPYLYDGRDRVTVFGEKATFVRMVYPTDPGTVLASAWEISEVADWGTSFVTVLGEDLDFNGSVADDADFAGLSVMALLPNTQVYYKGSLVATLNAGGTYFINGANDGAGGGGVDSTDTITATAPVQVQMLVGGCGSAYSGNGHSLEPIDRWGDAYWSPVPGFSCVSYDSDLYFHNASDTGIVVTATSNLGTVAMPIAAHTTRSLLDYARDAAGWEDVSTGVSGVHIYSPDPFWGVGVVDSSTDGSGASSTYDWSFSLVPEYDLSSQVVVGYAPGTGDALPTNNGNSAFVTAVTDTVIYVDLNQDGLPDPFDMNGDGDADDSDVFGVAEWDEPLSALGIPLSTRQTVRVGDPRDRNLQGALIYTLDYQHKIAAAWGQDLCCTGTGTPYLDLGYTLYPLPVPTLSKRDDLAIDADLTGDVSPGDTVTYTISLNNNGLGSMNDIVLTDTLPYTYTDFIVGSLTVSSPPPTDTIEYYDGSVWGTTPISNAQLLRITWDTLGPQQEITITFRTQLHLNIPLTVTEITNQAVVNSPKTDPKWSEDPDDPLDPDTDTPIGHPQLVLDKSASPDVVFPGDLVTYTLTVTNTGTGIAIDTVLSDVLPVGLTYVPDSLNMTWPLLELQVTTRTVTQTALFDGYYADDFDLDLTQTTHYTGSDGSLNWSADWAEVNDDNNPASGEIQVGSTAANALTEPGYLEMIDNDEDLANLQRGVDLTLFRQPLLRFYVWGINTDSSGDNYQVILNGSSVQSTNYNGDYTLVEQTLAFAARAPATVGFGAETGMDAGDIYRFDNIAVYEGDPERESTAILSWKQVVYTTTTGANPVSYNPVTRQLMITDALRLPARGVVEVTFQARIGDLWDQNTFLTNTAYVSATNWLEVIESPTATATIEVLVPNLDVNKLSSGNGVFAAGDTLTYTIVVTNTGSIATSDVTVYDLVPAHTSYVGGSSLLRISSMPLPVAAGDPPHLVTPADGYTLNPGEQMTVTFRVTVDDPLSAGVTTLANQATVTSTEIVTPVVGIVTDTLPVGTITGVVYEDVNGDGVYTPGVDTPLAGVDVVITDTAGMVYTITTNVNGTYTATVPSGSATVDVDDADLPTDAVLTTGSTDPTGVNVPAGGNASDDTGYIRMGEVTGVVYVDSDGDGTYTSGIDTPLVGVDVVITDTFGVAYTVTTAANGMYTATVPAGSATVDVDNADLPAGAILTTGSTDPTNITVLVGELAYDNTGYRIIDRDGDDVPDIIDLDDDNDGIPDVEECPGGTCPDTDGDGVPDYLDLDADDDGITDVIEAGGTDEDGDGIIDGYSDADGDGLSDNVDPDQGGTPLDVPNTDGDGNADYVDLDSDNDGIPDVTEAGGTDTNGDGIIDGYSDNDGDGLSDNVDPTEGGTPLDVPDTDGDGNADYVDVDTDNDGITDVIEAGGTDADGDGIIDGYSDSDGDGLSDNVDPTEGGTPLDVPDTDGDDRANYADIDADNDGIPDNIESQPTVGYVPPSGSDSDGDGLDDAYDPDSGGTPVPVTNTDSTDQPDYLDLNSDNDFLSDQEESDRGTLTGVDSDGDGLDDGFDDNIGPLPNDGITDPANTPELPDSDGNVNSGGDVDYRDPDVCVTPVDDYELDGFYTEAAVIATDGTELTRTFHVLADKDWVKFFAWKERTYTLFTLNLNDDVDTVLQVYDVDGKTLLDENDDYNPDSKASQIVWVAPADGWYYARVTHFDHTYDPRWSQVCGNGYQLAVIEALCPVEADAYEPDNLYTKALWLPSDGTPKQRTFGVVADKDWIKFDAVKGRVYTLTTAQLGGGVDTVLQLYDVDGKTLLDENDDYGDGEASRLVWTAASNATYFVRITHFDSTYDPRSAPVCGNGYQVSVATPLCDLVDRYEVDAHYTEAPQVPANGALFARSFNTVGDKDWISFYGRAGQAYTITTSTLDADVDTVLQLYGMDGETLIEQNDDYETTSRASRIVWTSPQSGWYFARITHFDQTYDPRYAPTCGGRYAVSVDQDVIGINKVAISDENILQAGDTVEYVITVWNNLNTVQPGVVITDPIPAGTVYVPDSAHTTQGVISGPDPLVVNVGTLAVNGTVTFTFQVTVAPGTLGEIVNRAEVSSAYRHTYASTPSIVTEVRRYLYLPYVIRRHSR